MRYLIVDLTEVEQLPPLFSTQHVSGPKVIPDRRRPSVLQPDLETAEQEALRLARSHPERRFVVFQAVQVATTVKVASHVTLGGKTVYETQAARLMKVVDSDEEVPF